MGGEQYENKSELFWGEFKNIPNNIWERATRQILETEDRFPTISRIKSVLQEVARSFYGQSSVPETPCETCDGEGYVSTVKVKNKEFLGEYVFRCSCVNGAYKEKATLLWESKFLKMGHVLRADWSDSHNSSDGFLEKVKELKEKAIKDSRNFENEVIKMFDGKVI